MKIKTLLLLAATILFMSIFNTTTAQVIKPLPLNIKTIEGAGLEPPVIDDKIDFWAKLDEEGNVYMNWSKYAHDENFQYYKIVRSQDNANPIYPKDGYVFFTDKVNELSWTDTSVPFGTSWYRICHVADPKVYCSAEVQKIVKPVTVDKGALKEIQPIRLPVEKPVEKPKEIKNTPDTKQPSANEPSTSIESFISEYWVQFLALIVSIIGVALAVTGFTLAGAKKKKSVSKFLNQIDDTFAEYKWKSKRCEAELYRLHDLVDEQLKKGKLDEGAYEILHKRIEKYLAEIKEIDNLPHNLKEKP
jgi:hypothetical protein